MATTMTTLQELTQAVAALTQAVVDLRVRVANSAAALAGTLIDNAVSYSYALSAGGVPINGGSASTTEMGAAIAALI